MYTIVCDAILLTSWHNVSWFKLYSDRSTTNDFILWQIKQSSVSKCSSSLSNDGDCCGWRVDNGCYVHWPADGVLSPPRSSQARQHHTDNTIFVSCSENSQVVKSVRSLVPCSTEFAKYLTPYGEGQYRSRV